MSGPHFPGMGEDGPDPSATPRVETPEPLSDLVAQAIDNLMYEGIHYSADWLDEVTDAVMSEVEPAIAAAVREERERLATLIVNRRSYVQHLDDGLTDAAEDHMAGQIFACNKLLAALNEETDHAL